MAQALQFQFGSSEFSCAVSKVDRTKLYGSVQLEVLDENGRKCDLATLAGDGKTLIPSGGTALAYLSPDGLWRDKKDLTPVDLDGDEITEVTSTFKVSTDLTKKASYEDYFSHNIRLIYELQTVDEDVFPPDFVAELNDGAIYTFPFSYRGGLEADAAFILAGPDGTIWMTVGKQTKIHFVGVEESGAVAEEEEGPAEEEEDGLDFGF